MAVAGIVWGLFNVGYIVFFSFTPTLLVERGLTLVAAGNLASLGLWLGMPALPLGGLLAERSGHPRAAMVVFSLACGAFLLLLSGSPAPLLFCILFGVAIGPPAGVIMALPAEVLPPERRAMGFAVFYTVYYVGMAVGPALAGFARDRWQSAAAALVAGALMFWAIPPMLLLFRAVARPLRR
jgi:MFS family permease